MMRRGREGVNEMEFRMFDARDRLRPRSEAKAMKGFSSPLSKSE
jgi:hypothetical protein